MPNHEEIVEAVDAVLDTQSTTIEEAIVKVAEDNGVERDVVAAAWDDSSAHVFAWEVLDV